MRKAVAASIPDNWVIEIVFPDKAECDRVYEAVERLLRDMGNPGRLGIIEWFGDPFGDEA